MILEMGMYGLCSSFLIPYFFLYLYSYVFFLVFIFILLQLHCLEFLVTLIMHEFILHLTSLVLTLSAVSSSNAPGTGSWDLIVFLMSSKKVRWTCSGTHWPTSMPTGSTMGEWENSQIYEPGVTLI